MAFFSVPAQPNPADVADALSLAGMAGWLLRARQGSRPSLMDAFQAVAPLGVGIAHQARRWCRAHTQAMGSDDSAPALLRASTILACSLVEGSVARGTDLGDCLVQLPSIQPHVLGLGRRLPGGASLESGALLLGGAMRGDVLGGESVEEALARAELHLPVVSRAALGLVSVSHARFGEAEGPDRLSDVSHIYGAALSGLVSRGLGCEDSLAEVAQSQAVIFAQVVELAGLPLGRDPVLPAVSAWRRRSEAVDASSPTPVPGHPKPGGLR